MNPLVPTRPAARRCLPAFRATLGVANLLIAASLSGCVSAKPGAAQGPKEEPYQRSYYLPNARASRLVSVSLEGSAPTTILVQTHRVAVKETGPKETVAKFGEVYAFSPNFFAVRREEPTRIRFWNLQPDDEHDFMLIDPQAQVLMSVLLPPLQERAYVFTFHEEGLFNFVCAMHPTVMTGQILVLPPKPH
jgi:plastocyanin